jgi:hypothetical protein
LVDNSNEPKILVEFTPEEIAWLADRMHEEWQRTVAAKAIASSPDALTKVEAHQKMEYEIRTKILDNAYKQGFGDL